MAQPHLAHREPTHVLCDAVYKEPGGGFLESVNRRGCALAPGQAGLPVASEVAIPVHFRGTLVREPRADRTVEGGVLLEVKAVSALKRSHEGSGDELSSGN